ncbi:TetR family transcriptional regulator [Pseudofrankia sp. BMG5.37]|uniref:TetR family transcriptional regulator n=1 Tax=Pseudofrankia sp. BMG5.37 TaxID=3050035 RepID=UPI0028957BDE|nr:TetR family transcriptional regulator [Pseudofrankia sp. BMG5.37]MDT3444953.1 TetR family transcriptional regulator [Pseudofrankia sp. BMG5.37]
MTATGSAAGGTAAGSHPTDTSGAAAVGLRERLRQTVRDELSTVALQLFLDRGFDATTVDEIAAAAGGSRSTFFRYFAKKDDVILAQLEARADALHATALSRPQGEPLMVVARAALDPLVEAFSQDRERSIALGQLVASTPSLGAQELRKYQYWRAVLAEALGHRLGVEADAGMRASVVASVAVSAFDVAVRVWRTTDTGRSLAATVDDAFAGLATEFASAGDWPTTTSPTA